MCFNWKSQITLHNLEPTLGGSAWCQSKGMKRSQEYIRWHASFKNEQTKKAQYTMTIKNTLNKNTINKSYTQMCTSGSPAFLAALQVVSESESHKNTAAQHVVTYLPTPRITIPYNLC